MNWNELKATHAQYVMQTRTRYPIDITRGEGPFLFDAQGREYLDFTSGGGAASLGYGHAQWADTILEQALTLGHASGACYSQPATLLAEQLCRRSGMVNAALTNTGSEANEAMIKLARKYSYDRYGPGRGTILTLTDAYHGQTVTTLSASALGQAQPYFAPLTEGFRPVEASMEAIRGQTGSDICAIMLEPLEKNGGAAPLTRQFLHALAVFCAEHDWLLLIDEVQTGIGRCGTLFAFQQYGILPDVVSFAGGLGGGLPIGGILANNRCKDVFSPGDHGGTFAENPICCAAALTVLDVLNEDTLAQVKEKGDYFRSGLDSLGIPIFRHIHGTGLQAGVTLTAGKTPEEIATLLSDFRLFCLPYGDGLLFMPPLLITRKELDQGLGIIKHALGEGA